MCKILLRGPKPPELTGDSIVDRVKFRPGDFVDAFPDDHVFGSAEVEPVFSILSVPDMTVEEALRLCVTPHDQMDSANNIVKFAPRKLMNFDLALIDTDVTKAELLATATVNPLIENPEIIGPPENEVG